MVIKYKKMHPSAIIPNQAKKGDAGYDLYAIDNYELNPLARVLVRTGISLEIPEGYYGRIAPRSGLSLKSGIDVMGGVIDSSFRGEIGVILINLNADCRSREVNPAMSIFSSKGGYRISPGDKIAQIIIEKCASVEFEEGDLSETERGVTGYGSSGN